VNSIVGYGNPKPCMNKLPWGFTFCFS